MIPRRLRFVPTLLLSASLLGGLLAAGCDETPEPAPPTERAAEIAAEVMAGASAPLATAPADPATAEVVAPADWRAWMDAEVAALQASDRSRFDALMSMEPLPTRAQTLRFRGDLVRDPAAAPVLLHRLVTSHEDAAVRAAIVEALPRTGADVGTALADLLALESDAGVREVIVATSWRASSDAGLATLRRGMNDAAPEVRAAAVQAAARHARASELASELVAALSDTDDATRLQAIRAVGALKLDSAKAPLVALLSEDSGKVRASSVRALGRIDASWAAAQPQVAALSSDPDPAVTRAVSDLSR